MVKGVPFRDSVRIGEGQSDNERQCDGNGHREWRERER